MATMTTTMTTPQAIMALVRGLISVWIVGASISSCLAQLLGLNEPLLAAGSGILAMLWIVPGAAAILLGILGLPNSWLEIIRQALSLFPDRDVLGKLSGLLGILYKTTVFLPFECPPSLKDTVPSWIQWLLFREPEGLYPPPPSMSTASEYKDEYWIFVNGIATTREMGKANVSKLSQLLGGRPIWFCHNPTDGIFVDLLECITGKIGFFRDFWIPKPEKVLRGALLRALQAADRGQHNKVVLLAHSQGTIITAQVLKSLPTALTKKYLQVYCFANCAQYMPGTNVQYLENLSNHNDTVTWLGVLFPFKEFWRDIHGQEIVIGGEHIEERALWGHLLNTHYLTPMETGRYFKRSRLPVSGQRSPALVTNTTSSLVRRIAPATRPVVVTP